MMQKSTLWLIPAIIIALGASWFHSQWLSQQEFIAKIDKARTDYYLSDFSLLVTDAKGHLKYNLDAQHFVHNVESKQSKIYKPFIEAKQATDAVSLTADEALHVKSGEIMLSGNVTIERPESLNAIGFVLKTEDLTYSPTHNTINSTSPFKMTTSQGSYTQGTGLKENLKENTLRIKSNVHTTFKPTQ